MTLPTSRASPDFSMELMPDVLTPPPTKHKHSAADALPVADEVSLADVPGCTAPGGTSFTALTLRSASRVSKDEPGSRSALSAVDDIINEVSRLEDGIARDADLLDCLGLGALH